jgi:hypothetical protein
VPPSNGRYSDFCATTGPNPVSIERNYVVGGDRVSAAVVAEAPAGSAPAQEQGVPRVLDPNFNSSVFPHSGISFPDGATSVPFAVATSAVPAIQFVDVNAFWFNDAIPFLQITNGRAGHAWLVVVPPEPAPAVAMPTLGDFLITGLNPVTGGEATIGQIDLSGLSRAGGPTLTLSSSHPDVVPPLSVFAPATQQLFGFQVSIPTNPPAVDTDVTITATDGRYMFSDVLRVGAPPPLPLLSGVSVAPTSVVGGQSSTGTVTLSAPAPSGGTVATLSDVGDVTTIPASVTVPAGATSASFAIATQPVSETFNANIWARVDGVEKQALLIVQPSTSPSTASLSAVAVNPTSVVGGNSAQGTVTLTSGAPSGGMSVALTSGAAAVNVPASVTVPAGASSASFTIATSTVTTTTSATIGANALGTSRTATLTVTPASTTGTVSSAPSLITPANRAVVSQPIAFDWSNVANAATYELQIDASSAFTAPLTRGLIVATSQATVSGLPAQRLYWRVRGINAAGAAGPFSSSRRFDARAQTTTTTPSLSSLSVSPTSVVGGSGSQGTVTLTSAAPSGGAVLTLSTSNSAVASVPASVTIAAGASSASFSIATASVSASTSSTLTASWNGVSRTASLTVTAPQATASLSSLTLNPTSVTGGSASQGTVTLTAAAPSGGAVVALSSSSGAAAVPASVTVPAGATSTTFPVSTSAVTADTAAGISGSFGGVSRTATLTVKASSTAQSYTLTVTATGRSGERVLSSPTGISVSVGSTGSATFTADTSITLSVSNRREAIWSGACSSGGNKATSCTFRITSNASVTGNVQ